MEIGPEFFERESTEALIEQYLRIDSNKPMVVPEFTADQRARFESVSTDAETLVPAVQNGLLGAKEAETAILGLYDPLFEDFPEIAQPLLYSQLWGQAKVWIADSLRVLKASGRTQELKDSQERAARILLRADYLMGTKNFITAKCIFHCLINCGRQHDAIRIARASFGSVIFAKNQAETEALVRSLGETDPVNIKLGIARVYPEKLNLRARNN